MIRTPLSAPGSFLSNAEPNPSVTRVETNAEPAASRLLKLIVEGSGEPTQRMPVEASVASSPRAGDPTASWLVFTIVIELGEPALNASVARIGCGEPGPSWL